MFLSAISTNPKRAPAEMRWKELALVVVGRKWWADLDLPGNLGQRRFQASRTSCAAISMSRFRLNVTTTNAEPGLRRSAIVNAFDGVETSQWVATRWILSPETRWQAGVDADDRDVH
jgi:hypothetical protein